MRALVTGANGFIGSHMCEQLLARGVLVRALVRRTSNLEWIHELDVELVNGELRDPGSLAAAAAGTDRVFHCAADVRPRDPDDYRRVNYQGTRALAAAAAEAGVGRLVLLSSMAAAGPAVGPERPRTEAEPCRPVSRYGEGKLLAEQAVGELADEVSSVILRLPAVYGPRDRDGLEMFKFLRWRVWPAIAGTFSLIYVRDAVRAALLASDADVPSATAYFVSDGGCHTYEDVVRVAERLLGIRARRVRVPRWLLMHGGRLSRMLSRQGSIFNPDKVQELLQECWVCDPARARAELGFAAEYDLEQGLTETFAWYRERNLL